MTMTPFFVEMDSLKRLTTVFFLGLGLLKEVSYLAILSVLVLLKIVDVLAVPLALMLLTRVVILASFYNSLTNIPNIVLLLT